ncbi:MAG TPA: cytochrome b [Paenalcaligenes sp.]|nr:cytochrome b [Paenalcaligenes sp.]
MLFDTKLRYGSVTRFLHWLMAIGLIWMLFTATVHWIDRDSALNDAIWPYHPLVGFSILVLGVVRVLWALTQKAKRPDNDLMARVGHFALYLFMLLTPIIALLRAFGSGRGFNYFGLQVISPGDDKIEALVDFGNQWHSVFGWLLFALIIGHVVMSFYHRSKGPEYNVFPRIIGHER